MKLFLIGLLALGTAACGNNEPSASVETTIVNAPVYGVEVGGYMASTGSSIGEVAIRDDCLVLIGPDEVAVGTVWPAGTRWDGASQQLLVDGRLIAVGDRITVHGAIGDPPDLNEEVAWTIRPLARCTALFDTYYWVNLLG